MDLLANLSLGFSGAFSPTNVLYAFVGCMIGTLVGVLPGLGTATTMAMLLPITFYLSPLGALIMLAGIYYGAQYGGSTTSILVNIPGESASIVTCLDGHEMATQGRAGAALAVAALGSFFAGTVGTLLIAALASPLAQVALSFQAPEYFSLVLLGLTGTVVLARGSVVKAVGMMMLGLGFGLIGTDLLSGTRRYTFDLPVLSDGIGLLPLLLGTLGVAEIIRNLENRTTRGAVVAKVGKLWLTLEEFRRSWLPVARGTALGLGLGLLPGLGALLSSFSSYAVEKKMSKTPEQFGHGAIEGVAGPEAANNAGAQTSFIPMLTLGIPSNAVMALMMGAMTIHGIVPGPRVITNQPDLFWAIIASMWIGNAMLVIINLPLIGMWVQLLRVPYRLLFPAIVLVVCIGGYSFNNSAFEIGLVAAFGVFGYFMMKLGCEPAPLAFGFILGPLLEDNLRRAMLVGRGDPMVFVERPISLALLLAALALFLLTVVPHFRRTREAAFQE